MTSHAAGARPAQAAGVLLLVVENVAVGLDKEARQESGERSRYPCKELVLQAGSAHADDSNTRLLY